MIEYNMQEVEAFLQEKISFHQIDVNKLVELTKTYQDPDSQEYKLLELTLNQVLSKYLEIAQSYIEK